MKNVINIQYLKLSFLLVFTFMMSCDNSKKSNEIKIGFVNPMTGELAMYGEAVKRGVDLALEEVNRDSLLGNQKLSIIMVDSKGETKEAVTATQKLINLDKVNYIIGDISSTVTLSILPITEKAGKFLFSPGAATPKLTNAGKLFARNWPSNNEEANSAAEYTFKILNYKNATIVYVNNDWGLGLQEYYEKKFTELSGKIDAKLIYEYENKDFRTLILKLKESKSEIIYLAGNQIEMGHFMKQLREAKINIPVISNTSFLTEDCIKIAGSYSENVIVPTPAYNPKDSLSSISKFYNSIKTKYNFEPSLAEANGYEAVMLIVKAIKEKGNDPIKVAEYIRNLKNYSGAGGVVNYVNGDISMKNEFKIIKNGKPELIK